MNMPAKKSLGTTTLIANVYIPVFQRAYLSYACEMLPARASHQPMRHLRVVLEVASREDRACVYTNACESYYIYLRSMPLTLARATLARFVLT